MPEKKILWCSILAVQTVEKYCVILPSHLALKLFPLVLMAQKAGGTVVVKMVLMLILIILCVVLIK